MDNDVDVDERVLAVLPGLDQKARQGLINKPKEWIYDYIDRLTGESDGRIRYSELFHAGYLCPTEEGKTELLPLAQKVLSDFLRVPLAEPEQQSLASRLDGAATRCGAPLNRGKQSVGSHIPASWLPISIARSARPRASSHAPWRKPWRRSEWQRLAREVFPSMCKSCGIPNLPGGITDLFAYDLYNWGVKEQVGPTMIEAMIWEFGKHPEWARHSRRPAWKVFFAHRDDLVALVGQAQAKVGVSGVRDNRNVFSDYYTPRLAT